MKVLWSWLLELCDLDRQPTVEEGARALTRGGLEIEGLTDLGAGFGGVVVAEVVAKRPHPQADKLTLVDVIVERGGTATQVVCGAPNVPAPGRKVLWAQVGATLPGGLTLAAKPVKGVVSPGMLCAEDELGLGDGPEAHAGIIVLDEDDRTALGAPAQRALFLDDWLLEVNAPANRGDVLSHLGIARELVAVLRGRVVMPDTDLSAFAGGARPALAVEIGDPAGCARFTARVLDGLATRPSPRRIAQRLRSVGVRAISNLVDVTNYVMFELGQPLHAFDLDRFGATTIRVSRAADGEKLTTLDGVERTLMPGDLVVRAGATAAALGGVMGGLATEVVPATRRVLLEAAAFDGLAIRRTARRLGLTSEASLRFGRGVDPELTELASRRAARLLCQLGGGTVLGDVVDSYPRKRAVPAIPFRLSRARLVSGVPALDASTCRDALQRLGCVVIGTESILEVTPPSSRPDVAREVDLVEEVLRISGYDQVVATLPALRQVPAVQPPDRAELVRTALAAAGANEAITFAFQSVARNEALGLSPHDRRTRPIALRNPMSSDQAVMRTSLLPNLLAAVARNRSHGRPDIALFEVGSVFLRKDAGMTERPPTELPDEPLWASGVLSGRRPAQLGSGTPWDAFDAKALAEVAIRAITGDAAAIRTRATTAIPYLHPGVAGELVIDGIVVGWFGEVHPAVRQRLDLDVPVFAFDLELDRLALAPPAQMRPISKFFGSARDVSLLLDASIPAARVHDVIAEANEPLVAGVALLEDFRDAAKLGAGNKSMLWSISYRSPDRTLTDVEVDQAHEAIVGRLVANVPAQRR